REEATRPPLGKQGETARRCWDLVARSGRGRRSAAAQRLEPERPVEPADQRQHDPIVGLEHRGEARTGHLGVGELPPYRERLVAQPAGRGMILAITARYAPQHLFLAEAAEAAHGRCQHDALETTRVPGDRGAELLECGPRRPPAAAADERYAGLQVEVEARSAAMRFASHLRRPVSVE